MKVLSYRILADGKDITSALQNYLSELEVTYDMRGMVDSLELSFDNTNMRIDPPRRGARLKVYMASSESGLVFMGEFIVDEYTYYGPPLFVAVHASSSAMHTGLKEQKNREFEKTTLAAVVEEIAFEHNLTAKVHPDIANISVERIDQLDESDIHFLTRLARDHHAVVKIMGNLLVLLPYGKARTAQDKILPGISLTSENIISYRMTANDRERYQSVDATWQDPEETAFQKVHVGTATPCFHMSGLYSSVEQATQAAKARYKDITTAGSSLNIKCHGNPHIALESPLFVKNMGKAVDGFWVAGRVQHTMTPRGYSTKIDGRAPAFSTLSGLGSILYVK